MERLTERYNGYIRVKGCTTLYGNEERPTAPAANAIVRLAAYEDTGLTPEEIVRLLQEWKAVCHLHGINSAANM